MPLYIYIFIRIDIDTKNTPSWNLQFIFHFLNALRLNNMQDTTLVLVACFFWFLFCICFWLRFNCSFCLLLRYL